jgi:hypothetical protein
VKNVRSFLNVNSTMGGELSDTSVCSTMHLGFDFSKRLLDTWNRKPLSGEGTTRAQRAGGRTATQKYSISMRSNKDRSPTRDGAHADEKQRTDLTPFALGSQLSNLTLIFFNCASDGGNLQAATQQRGQQQQRRRSTGQPSSVRCALT